MMDPLVELASWVEEARSGGEHEPEAMALASVGELGAPSVRIVLCRGIGPDGLRFFTNYASRKGEEFAVNPRAAVVFHWKAIERQARVEGEISKLPPADSDAYFAQRPRGSQLGAWASPQSSVVESLEIVRERQKELALEFAGKEVPRPPHWGGYLLRPSAIELWRAGADRIHERVRFERVGGSPGWTRLRLAP
jgi:pyridoxamine 5'-phosphate oxidase